MIKIDWPGQPFGGIKTPFSTPQLPTIDEADHPTIIIQGGGPVSSSVYSKPRDIEEVSLLSPGGVSYLNNQLSSQVVKEKRADVLDDLSLNLARFLQEGETSVSQGATQYKYRTLKEQIIPIDSEKFVATHTFPGSEMSMSLKTKSGATLTFTFRLENGQGYDGNEAGVNYQTVAVDFQLDGKLTNTEKEQLSGLSEGLNQLANDYFSGKQPQLADLGLNDITVLSKLDLSLEGELLPDLKLSMTDTALRREIKANYDGNKLAMSVDKPSLVGTSDSDRRQAALAHYRQMLIEGVDRAQGKDDQEAFMLDAFDLLHGPVERAETRHELTDAESMMLTGLPDFSFHFEGRVQQFNTHPQRHNQIESFSLTLGQETHFKQDGVLNREVDQRQTWELDAGYFKPLVNWEFVDFQNQNYRYYELSERAEIQTLTGQEEGEPYGVQSRSFESSLDVQEYRMGELVDWTTKNRTLNEVVDFTPRLRELDDLLNHVKLEELLLDPEAMSKRAQVEVIDQDESAVAKVEVPQGRRPS
ncbi:hypothetical protein [Saccharospirillum mangrovi]|uniref:hypothetical protein n=1 Tax=Saccharospirillum mangrovi TaxID=2161747 RepID=UPI000D36C17A|nr:hypothetical protein [Saccharospirillum mangrovi]